MNPLALSSLLLLATMYLASGLALRSSSLAVRRGGAMSRPAARHLCMAAAVKGMSAKDFAGIIASPDARRLYQVPAPQLTSLARLRR